MPNHFLRSSSWVAARFVAEDIDAARDPHGADVVPHPWELSRKSRGDVLNLPDERGQVYFYEPDNGVYLVEYQYPVPGVRQLYSSEADGTKMRVLPLWAVPGTTPDVISGQMHRQRKAGEGVERDIAAALHVAQKKCDHPAESLTYHPDPSGNNDSCYVCELCHKEMRRAPVRTKKPTL